MVKGMFTHIITTLADAQDAVWHHDNFFDDKIIEEELIWIELEPDIICNGVRVDTLIDSLRRARRDNIRLILKVDDFKMIKAFPDKLRIAILNYCTFIGENGIEDELQYEGYIGHNKMPDGRVYVHPFNSTSLNKNANAVVLGTSGMGMVFRHG